jgi:hypothetical protein
MDKRPRKLYILKAFFEREEKMDKPIMPQNVEEWLNVLAIAAADTTKVRLEDVYTKIFKTGPGEAIKDFPLSLRRIIEGFLYSAHGILASKINPRSPLGKFVNEVVDDLPAEIGRRMLNGSLNASASHPGPRGELVSKLLDLDQDKIDSLADWFENEATEDEKREAAKMLKKASMEEIESFIAQSEEVKRMLIQMSTSQILGVFVTLWGIIVRKNREISEAIQMANDLLAGRRERLRTERLGKEVK